MDIALPVKNPRYPYTMDIGRKWGEVNKVNWLINVNNKEE